jgi:hypothetical protein
MTKAQQLAALDKRIVKAATKWFDWHKDRVPEDLCDCMACTLTPYLRRRAALQAKKGQVRT